MSTLKTDNIESLDTGRVIEVDSLSDRQDLANDDSGSGASLVSMEGGPTVEVAVLDRVIRVTSISGLNTEGTSNFQYSVAGYHSGSNAGGGMFYWDADRSKSSHNGGEIIDPDKTFPADWASRTQVYDWFDVTGSSGTGCYVAILDDLKVNLLRFGCFANGIGDDSIQVQVGLIVSVKSSRLTYAPSGTYLKGFNLDGSCPFSGSRWYEFEFPVDAFAGMEGDGVNSTEFKVADGLITDRGRFTFTFGILKALNTNAPKVIYQRNYTINKNGSNNPLNTGDGFYEFGQAHCFKIDEHEDGYFENIKVKDVVGGGLVHSSNTSRFDVYKNITWADFSGNFGRRSDVEIQGFPRLAILESCYLDTIQTEPNGLNGEGYTTIININGGKIDAIDCNGTSNLEQTVFVLSDLKVNRTVRLSSAEFFITNCDLLVREFERNQYINSRIEMTGGRMLYEVDGGDINAIYPRVTNFDRERFWSFKGVKFEIDSNDPAFTPSGNGRAFDCLEATHNADVRNYISFDSGCEFDARFKQIAKVYRSYQLSCKNSKIRCSGKAFLVGTEREGLQKVTLQGNDYSEFEGTSILEVVLPYGNADNFAIDIKEKMDASKWAITGNGAGKLEDSGSYSVNVDLVGDTEISNGKIHGVRQYRKTPTDTEWYLKAYRSGASVDAITLS